MNLCTAFSQNPEMTGVHLSDNGIMQQHELLHEIINTFGVPCDCLHKSTDNYKTNKEVIQYEVIRQKVKQIV